MHDLAMAKEVLDLTLAYAKKYKLQDVKEVNLELGRVMDHGELVSAEHLKEHFNMLTKGTMAVGAKLIVKQKTFNGFKLKDITGNK